MQVEIKFKKTGSNSVYGSFAAGDVKNCSKELAEFYVSQGLAVYTTPITDDKKPATKNASKKSGSKGK